MTQNRFALAALLLSFCAAPVVFADEGMWTYNNFPADRVAQSYGFRPDQAWLDKVRLGSARLAQGCSASFVAADGLVMTNHHCAHRCIEELSTKKDDLVKHGFVARSWRDERRCPALEVNQLIDIVDVTARILNATAGKSGGQFTEAQQAEIAKITQECSTSERVRCDVVTLYAGGVYNLYKYKRFQDVRLVFAPEFDIAFFGGDPDNFNFPRYNLDVTFLRVYEADAPASIPEHLSFSKEAVKPGDLTFTSGHPGKTSRNATVAELAFLRDVDHPARLLRIAELRGMITEFQGRGAEQKRISNQLLASIENGFKARLGYWSALKDPSFFGSKVAEQERLVSAIKDPGRKAMVSASVDAIARAQKVRAELFVPYMYLEGGWGFMADTFRIARSLVRAADELTLPNDKRLRGFTDSELPGLKQQLFSPAPIHPELEMATLTFGLTKLREHLGADHPVVKKVLGKKSPASLAKELLSTKLGRVAERQRLFAGGKQAIDTSSDPMIRLVQLMDGEARAVRTRWEHEVQAVIEKESETLAKARFDAMGTTVYPDATFTLRLSYGSVEGWAEPAGPVFPITRIAGAYDRHTGEAPFALPVSWIQRKQKLDHTKVMNFVTSNDIIGGNSGSPVVNKHGEIVGLIFDGNIHSLGGDYGFNPENNRAVAVHTDVILETLDKIYGAEHIAAELRDGRRPK